MKDYLFRERVFALAEELLKPVDLDDENGEDDDEDYDDE